MAKNYADENTLNKEEKKLKLQEAVTWAVELYRQRTVEVATNPKVSMYYVDCTSRVSWHEVAAKFDFIKECVNYRLDFQPVFEEAMKQAKLFKVLKGKESAKEWYEKNCR